MDNTSANSDNFGLHSLYPEAGKAFGWKPTPLKEMKDDCLVVLDSSVLLLPYEVMPDSFREIREVLKKLREQNRLRIAAHSTREFLNNRPKKLAEIFTKITENKTRASKIGRASIPLLEDVPAYIAATETEREINTLITKYQKQMSEVLGHIKGWEWSDPLSMFYHQEIDANCYIDTSLSSDEIIEEASRRKRHQIPPGYKDSSKETNGDGDITIWMSILEMGKKEEKHCVLVTNDFKSDWWHRASNEAIYPRFELVDEYRRSSNGHTFHMTSLSSLLTLMGASDNVVENIKNEEREQPETLDLARIMEDWPSIVQRTNKIDRRVAALLVNVEPIATIGRTLLLATPYPFHLTRIQSAKEKEILESAIESMYGRPVTTVIQLVEKTPTEAIDPPF